MYHRRAISMEHRLKLISILILISSYAHSYDNNYYPNIFLNQISQNVRNGELKNKIFSLLNERHTKYKNGRDKLGCQSGGECYSQKKLNYGQAKSYLFGELHLERDNQNEYYIKDVYCNIEYHSGPKVGKIGPGKVPNHKIVNCEHTWPQSRFSSKFNSKLQKSDLHHLYPTNSRANSIRGSYDFGEVNDSQGLNFNCKSSSFANRTYEPPKEHRGNVARSMFYFAVRYRLPIDDRMEKFLKKWHREDPVDLEEERRNDKIFSLQNNRNPFIDYPKLVSRINNF